MAIAHSLWPTLWARAPLLAGGVAGGGALARAHPCTGRKGCAPGRAAAARAATVQRLSAAVSDRARAPQAPPLLLLLLLRAGAPQAAAARSSRCGGRSEGNATAAAAVVHGVLGRLSQQWRGRHAQRRRCCWGLHVTLRR
eukprot:TRINITY_DN3842_c0_g2_i2.p1 TRINITY_DN3842_c0_g2~~TRINITY_DN3842_c0_g2_i2.p1  ORF type:complete len:140 (-),score=39.80 TRINITY_DN3842_c0_g2_i2:11-430(-)